MLWEKPKKKGLNCYNATKMILHICIACICVATVVKYALKGVNVFTLKFGRLIRGDSYNGGKRKLS